MRRAATPRTVVARAGERARSPRRYGASPMRRRVTFSRNLTLSLSRTCRCYCKYCAFATHRPHLHAPDEVSALLDGAARRNVKELLVLTGERPEVNAGVRARLAEYGHEDFVAYVVWACERALERGLLPHTNLGVLSAADLARLREVTASQGLMLESVNPDLVAHQGSPTKHPAERAGDDPRRRRAADPVHERDPRRDRRDARRSASRRSRRSPPCTPSTATCRRSSCRTSSRTTLLRRRSRRRSPTPRRERCWRTGIGAAGSPRTATCRPGRRRSRSTTCAGSSPSAGGSCPTSACRSRRTSPTGGRSSSRAGATDLGGLSANGDHISPEHPLPVAAPGAQAPRGRGLRADRAAVRLPALHRPRVDRAGRARRRQGALLELHPAPRQSGRTRAAAADPPRPRRPARSARGRDGGRAQRRTS